MGQIILCETKEAEHAYYLESLQKEILSYEELLYYIREYFIIFAEEGFPEDLLSWLVNELGIRDLEADWKLLKNNRQRLERLIGCRNYFLPQGISVLMKKYDRYQEMNPAQRKSLLGDEYLKQERYEKALKLYQQANNSQNNARICYNIGVCYAHQWDFEMAAEYFLKSYQSGGKKRAQNAYFSALMMQGDFSSVQIMAGSDYRNFMDRFEEAKALYRESADKRDREKNNQYKKNLLEQWKQRYHREVD